MDAILEQFLTEARDNLEYLDRHLEELNGGDEETINALFRAAHTLKGGAGLVGLNSIKEVTHAAEDLLDAYRNKEIVYSDEIIDILYDAFDEIIEMIDAVEELGSIEIEVDESKIDELKNSIRSFLNNEQNDETPKIETSLNINSQLDTTMFNSLQIQKLAKKLPFYTPKFSKEFQENDNWYLINLDLDMETLKLGNDPVYLFYLLENNEFEVAIQTDCKMLKDDNLLWVSAITGAIKSTETKIMDTFFNLIDEIEFDYLSIEKLFYSNYPNIDNEMFEDFKNELVEIVSNEEYELLDEKLIAINQILNPHTKEGFILNRLHIILTSFVPKSEEYKEVIKIAIEKLGLTEEIETFKNSETKTAIELDEENKEVIKNLLLAQLQVLKLAEDDTKIERTKIIIEKVNKTLNKEIELTNLDKSELINYIELLLENLGIEKIEKVEEEVAETIEEQKIEENKEIPTEKVDTTKIIKNTETEKEGNNKQEVITKEKVIKKEKSKTSLKVPKQTTTHKNATPRTIKIEQFQIDELMDIVGELLVVKNAFPYISGILTPTNIEESKRELNTKYEEISRIIEQLQDRVMQMRLLPLEYIFGRYPKMVRDISKKLNKKIKYIESGGETKLDKTVIEKLADPLVHIIRNSLDHGIESPQEREVAGKNPEGILEIKATSQGDKVFIIIKDDGRGIDLDKVVSKALEKKLVAPELLDKMSREEKLKLIFLPGLSTNDEVTELSGRGVGTDAVKKVIEELGGKIYIKSQFGYGTEIKFELPLSVALTNVFHIMMNGVNYAIAMDYIVETFKSRKEEIQIANHKPFIKIRGELIPLFLEEELLGYSNIKDENSIVIIKYNDKKVGFVVDEFVGQLDVVQKPLTGVISAHPFISGVSLLGNGNILFILDITKILKDLND